MSWPGGWSKTTPGVPVVGVVENQFPWVGHAYPAMFTCRRCSRLERYSSSAAVEELSATENLGRLTAILTADRYIGGCTNVAGDVAAAIVSQAYPYVPNEIPCYTVEGVPYYTPPGDPC
jgi:hypothetical protein